MWDLSSTYIIVLLNLLSIFADIHIFLSHISVIMSLLAAVFVISSSKHPFFEYTTINVYIHNNMVTYLEGIEESHHIPSIQFKKASRSYTDTKW
jgi:hypothetical protein